MSLCATNVGRKGANSEGENSDANVRMKKRRILRRVFTSLGVFFCFFAFLIWYMQVEPVTSSVTVELGDSVSREITDYIKGKPLALKIARLNLPVVQMTVPGEYKAEVKYLFWTYEYDIFVSDTTAPAVIFNTENFVCEINREYSVLSFVDSCRDASSNLEYKYLNIDSDNNVILRDGGHSAEFLSPGIHNLELIVSDDSGNCSTYRMPIIADSAPEIFADSEFFTAKGSNIDILKYAGAYDEEDGALNVSAHVPADCFNIVGDHTVKYTAVDSLGVETTKESILHVFDPLVLQDMFNTKRLDAFAENVAGIINPYDTGYLTEPNIDEAINGIKDSVVRIHYATKKSLVNGSGYIVKINDDSVIICTNNHVIKGRDTVSVSFINGQNYEGTVVAGQAEPDIAFVSVPIDSLDENTRERIRSIHVNRGYYESLSDQPMFDMGIYCIYESGLEWIKRTGKIVRKSGYLEDYFEGYDYEVTEVSIKLSPGVSGSAIIDAHGNLLCMAAFLWKHDGIVEYYGISLDDILDFYKESFGEALEYY